MSTHWPGPTSKLGGMWSSPSGHPDENLSLLVSQMESCPLRSSLAVTDTLAHPPCCLHVLSATGCGRGAHTTSLSITGRIKREHVGGLACFPTGIPSSHPVRSPWILSAICTSLSSTALPEEVDMGHWTREGPDTFLSWVHSPLWALSQVEKLVSRSRRA